MSYDAWKTGWNDYEREAPDCRECKEKDQTVDEIAEWFDGILDILYGNEKFSEGELERRIDEVCHYLNLKMRTGDLQIEKKRPKLPPSLKWIVLNDQPTKELSLTM